MQGGPSRRSCFLHSRLPTVPVRWESIPGPSVEIPVASDLADRVEALLGIRGIAVRIRELESGMSREEAALRIGDDFVDTPVRRAVA